MPRHMLAVHDDLWTLLEPFAKREHRSMANMIMHIIQLWLEEQEEANAW